MRVKKKALAAGALFVVTFALILLLNPTQDVASISVQDTVLEQQVLELQESLRKAEKLNRQREDELHALLVKVAATGEKPNNLTNTSISEVIKEINEGSRLQTPGIHSYLPHLAGHPEKLRPSTVLSKGRKGVSISIGIPTIKRAKNNYLFKTLESLIVGLNSEEKGDCVIVVFIAEPWDLSFAKSITSQVQLKFSEHLQSGLLEVIVPPAGFYPDLNNLKETFGDTKERVKWRTKQNLDYAFLMLYSKPKSIYYAQMEDDVIAKPGYLTIMKTFAAQQKSDWMMLEFSALGFIGKMLKSTDVPMVVEFFLMFHADKPIDWLMDHLLWVKVCSPEKDAKHCQRMIQAVRRRFKPSLFQHVGIESSLKGKVQKLKDRDFGKAGLYRAHVNPSTQIASSLKTYQKYTLSKAYMGETFFWASNPSKGDIIDFKFEPALHLDTYLFRSGNRDHPGDIFLNTTVEINPQTRPDETVVKGIISRSGVSIDEKSHTDVNFIPISRFDDSGVASGEIPEGLGAVKVLRIHVHENSNAWVILSEIMIKEMKPEK